jgi:hypothetical protein
MNWFKYAQQLNFDFYNNLHDYINPRGTSELAIPSLENINFEDALDYISSESELVHVLNYYKIPYDKINFQTGKWLYLIRNEHIIDENFTLEEANEWARDIIDYGRIDDYITIQDFNEEFWQSVGPNDKLFHGTSENRIESILANGLEPRNETRGISNRSTGNAVFASESPETAAYYYDIVLQINVGEMAQDGFHIPAGLEGPYEKHIQKQTLLDIMGIEEHGDDFSSDGISGDTVLFYGKIPPKYIRVLD